MKLLLGSGAFAAGAWKVWSDARLWEIVFDVVGAIIVSWLTFLCVFFLTARYVRRAACVEARVDAVRTPVRTLR